MTATLGEQMPAAVPAGVELSGRLAVSDRLRRRRFELLPLSGPGACFTDVQGRGPGDATAPAALADLISSIDTVGVLQPILVEEIPGSQGGVGRPRRRLVAGERRLRACRWGVTARPDNPHFAAIPAVVCPGPLTEEERRTWQLVENLAREDLLPGELGAALLFERCAVLAAKLLAAGVDVPLEATAQDDPVRRWRAVEALRRPDHPHLGAPWEEVLRRLGLQVSERRARALAAAFAALPREVSADMDAHRITLATRHAYLRMDTGRRHAAQEMWAALKARGRPELLPTALREGLDNPEMEAAEAAERAVELRAAANRARARVHQHHDTDGPVDDEAEDDGDGARRGAVVEDPEVDVRPATSVDADVVAQALSAHRALLEELRAGACVAPYDAGSLRLLAEELLGQLKTPPRQRRTAA